MLMRLIQDIRICLENGCYFAALSLALTLPDICGKAAYPELEKQTKQRYTQWYDAFITPYNMPAGDDGTAPYLDGKVIYSLRNNLLHQGTPSTDKENAENERCKLDRFTLILQKPVCGICVDVASNVQITHKGKEPVLERHYTANVSGLCISICDAAEEYYKENNKKFNFFKCNIVDMDELKHLEENDHAD